MNQDEEIIASYLTFTSVTRRNSANFLVRIEFLRSTARRLVPETTQEFHGLSISKYPVTKFERQCA
jgi:hypothetical protein